MCIHPLFFVSQSSSSRHSAHRAEHGVASTVRRPPSHAPGDNQTAASATPTAAETTLALRRRCVPVGLASGPGPSVCCCPVHGEWPPSQPPGRFAHNRIPRGTQSTLRLRLTLVIHTYAFRQHPRCWIPSQFVHFHCKAHSPQRT
jgi:hypothetical protein